MVCFLGFVFGFVIRMLIFFFYRTEVYGVVFRDVFVIVIVEGCVRERF